MTETAPGSGLATLLDELGWSVEAFARKLIRYARRQGRREPLHHKTPYKWLHGQVPRPPWRTLTLALLSDELGRDIHLADLGWPDGDELKPASSGLQLPWTPQGSLQAMHVVTETGAMHRRLFLSLAGSALTTPALEWFIAPEAQAEAMTRGNARLTMDTVDQLDSITAALRRLDDQCGSGTLRAAAHANLRLAANLLKTTSYSATVGRRMHATVGELARFAGFLAFDSADHAHAQRLWITALHAAHTGGDRALAANILGWLSCQAKDLGDLRAAVTLAETARAGYRGASSQVATILQLRAAEAHAVAGDATSCRNAIDAAFSRLTDPNTDSPNWAYWMDNAQANAQAGYCYMKLGQWRQARHHIRAAMVTQDDTVVREGTLRQVLLGLTHVRQDNPDIEQAAACGHEALATLDHGVTSSRVTGHFTKLITELRPHRRHHAVAELIENQHTLNKS